MQDRSSSLGRSDLLQDGGGICVQTGYVLDIGWRGVRLALTRGLFDLFQCLVRGFTNVAHRMFRFGGVELGKTLSAFFAWSMKACDTI